MKKVLIILLLLVSFGFSQNHFEIEPICSFLDTISWVRLANDVNINLQNNTAYWQLEGLVVTAVETDSVSGDTTLFHFRTSCVRTAQAPYSGQSVTRNIQKSVTATKFDLTYTGREQ